MSKPLGKSILSDEPLSITEDIELLKSIPEAKAAFKKGMKYFEEQDLENAKNEFLKVLKFNNHNIKEYEGALGVMIHIYNTLDEPIKADNLFTHMTEKFPLNPAPYTYQAVKIVLKTGCTIEAEYLLKHAYDLRFPNFHTIVSTLNKQLESVLGNIPPCFKKYEINYLEPADDFTVLKNNLKTLQHVHGDDEQILKTLNDLMNHVVSSRLNDGYPLYKGLPLSNSKMETFISYKIELANRYININDLNKAEQSLNDVFKHQPNNTDALNTLFKLAIAHFNQREFEQAEKHATHVFGKLHSIEIGLELGAIYALQGKYNLALTLYNSLIKKHSTDISLYNSIGKCLYDMGELEEADNVLTKANELINNNPEINYSEITRIATDHYRAIRINFIKNTINLSVVLRALGKINEAAAVEENLDRNLLSKYSSLPITVAIYTTLLEKYKHTKDSTLAAYKAFSKHVIDFSSTIIEDFDTLVYTEVEFNTRTPEELVQDATETPGFTWEA